LGNGKAHGGDLAAFAAQDAGLLLLGRQEVDFVIQQELRHIGGADFGQYAVDIFHALLVVGLGNVGHMEQYVGLGGFFQRGREGGHQTVRQIAHEADGVGEDDAVFAVKIQAAGSGIERGEELVFGQHVSFGEAVKQTGFAGVGVAHQGEGGQAALLAGFAAGALRAAMVILSSAASPACGCPGLECHPSPRRHDEYATGHRHLRPAHATPVDDTRRSVVAHKLKWNTCSTAVRHAVYAT